MTKPEQEDTEKCHVQSILHGALMEASHRGQVTCGLYETAEALESNPALDGICILSKDPDDGGLLFMMETFCQENSIPVVKANNVKKLAEDVGLKSIHEDDGEALNCLLIEVCHHKWTRQSKPERKVRALCKLCKQFAKKGKQIIADVE